MHLVAIIRQVDELIHLCERIIVGARPQVTRLIQIEVLTGINKSKDANIELAPIEKQRPLYILLNDNLITFCHHDVADQFFPASNDLDTSPSILILWLDYPDVLGELASRESTIRVIAFFESIKVLSHFGQLRIIRQVLRGWCDITECHRALICVERVLK